MKGMTGSPSHPTKLSGRDVLITGFSLDQDIRKRDILRALTKRREREERDQRLNSLIPKGGAEKLLADLEKERAAHNSNPKPL